ncbi:uncharacterized protein LOC119608529 [Lucilia sericata]|uniref:uncharacterized protein LOC119608529 n=1 Tax=Lucilia sericata TaxID=13632 RepID=UPI0018A80616|nr:uncharacterized protein LOC119608529 [Lucilia sericata]
MDCSNCKINKISPEINPFGGYFCSNEHMQCNECNTSSKGHCGLCNASTKFVQMNFKSSDEPLPATPQSSIFSKDQPIRSALSKQMLDEIETQSRISKEHLILKDSREYMHQNAKENDSKETNGMETLFVGTPAENSASLIGNSNHEDVGKNFNGLKIKNKKSINDSSNKLEMTRENVFCFEDDPNDTYIPTSEIRFMDSTESFQNFYTKQKTDELACVLRNNDQQPNSLSLKVLSNFETKDSVDKTEIVMNYLESCCTTSYHQSPLYNCQHSHCQFGWQPNNQKMKAAMKTVSVSTDSDPSLKSTCFDTTEASLVAKFKPRDFFIMQAMGVPPPIRSTANLPLEKYGKPCMDTVRMQKILETFKEDLNTTKFTEMSNFIKLSGQIPMKQQQEKKDAETQSLKKEDKNSILVAKLINAHRAVYSPPNPPTDPVNNLHLLSQPQSPQQEPPLPQFQTLPCSSAFAQELLQNPKRSLSLKPVPACVLNIPRQPIQCPESNCLKMIFVSDFNKHLVVDHNHLPMERIIPYQCKNFFLDARLAHCGTSKCHLLYLMQNKITDLGSSEYKDFLPILVMTTRISLNEMCGLKDGASTMEFFLIWITGIAPEEFPVYVSLTIWCRSGRVPLCHTVYSGKIYSIRESQRAFDVWQSGRMVLLSSQEIDALTSGGKEMLNLQLSVH